MIVFKDFLYTSCYVKNVVIERQAKNNCGVSMLQVEMLMLICIFV